MEPIALIIRDEQMRVLSAYVRAEFERGEASRLRAAHPERAAALGAGAVLDEVRRLISRAGEYRITGRDDVRRYLDLAWRLGPDFDRDPRHPWARDTLTDPHLPDDARVDVLCFRAAAAAAADGSGA